MADTDALPQLLQYRERRWLDHCSDVLENLLLPLTQQWQRGPSAHAKRGAVLIDNRINQQWLFTVINTALMCPIGTQLCLITDGAEIRNAQNYLQGVGLPLEPWWGIAEELVPGANLHKPASFNWMMKQPRLWEGLPHEQLLICQTDSLLVQPLPLFFFDYPYLGAPFLPKQHSETFERRNLAGGRDGFFKVERAIHGRPNPDVYPHLHGNGGLSIRHRSAMHAIGEKHAQSSPMEEMEDVFFSRHLNTIAQAPPLELAQAFSCESRYQPSAIGSHAAWKYWSTAELAEHLDQHWRQAWSMGEAHRHAKESNR
jgi:hypothetical protein